jgi:hypothetical protein
MSRFLTLSSEGMTTWNGFFHVVISLDCKDRASFVKEELKYRFFGVRHILKNVMCGNRSGTGRLQDSS